MFNILRCVYNSVFNKVNKHFNNYKLDNNRNGETIQPEYSCLGPEGPVHPRPGGLDPGQVHQELLPLAQDQQPAAHRGALPPQLLRKEQRLPGVLRERVQVLLEKSVNHLPTLTDTYKAS